MLDEELFDQREAERHRAHYANYRMSVYVATAFSVALILMLGGAHLALLLTKTGVVFAWGFFLALAAGLCGYLNAMGAQMGWPFVTLTMACGVLTGVASAALFLLGTL